MKKHALYLLFIFCICTIAASAQVTVNKDSLSLVKKLTDDKEKLLKLQSQVNDRTNEKEETASKARQSADENRRAAERLTDDPQDKKLARRADNAASDARSDANKARRASERLDDLRKDIRDLTDRIEKNQSKLNRYLLVQNNPAMATHVTNDSTATNH